MCAKITFECGLETKLESPYPACTRSASCIFYHILVSCFPYRQDEQSKAGIYPLHITVDYTYAPSLPLLMSYNLTQLQELRSIRNGAGSLIETVHIYYITYPSRLEAFKAVGDNPDAVIRDIGWKSLRRKGWKGEREVRLTVVYIIFAWSVLAFSCAQGAAAVAPKKRNYILLNVTGSRARNHKPYIPTRERAFGQ